MKGAKKTAAIGGLLLCAACSTPDYISPGVTEQEKNLSKSIIALEKTPERQKSSYDENLVRVGNVFSRLKEAGEDICRFTSDERFVTCNNMTVSVRTNETVNAYAYGDREIVVYTGLIDYTENDDELALVIGHEMGHHLADHINEDKQNAMVGSIVGGILLGIIGGASGNASLAGDMARLGTTTGQHLGALSFSQEQEKEADYIGSYLAAKAGYDVEKGSRFFVKMYKLNPKTGSQDLNKSALFDTHPTNDERHAVLLKIATEVQNKKSGNAPLLPHKGER